MKLNLEQIKEITRGTVDIELLEDGYHFYRFSKAQIKAYEENREDERTRKCYANSCVRFALNTDTEIIAFKYVVAPGSSRAFGGFDLYVDGVFTEHVELVEKVGEVKLTLEAGEKFVELYFPWSKCAILSDVEFSDGSKICGVKRRKVMLSYGDSITQGYDAYYPSLTYANQVSALLDADCCNKGIGAEEFFPELAKAEDNIEPDFITVAYGTNDWSRRDPATIEANATAFLGALREKYPAAPIYVITPIWRADNTKETNFGAPHWEVGELLCKVCEKFSNVRPICGYGFVPQVEDFYSDKYLHPNDLGFGLYAKNLALALQQFEK